MTFDEYQKTAELTAKYPDKHKIIYAALGLGNESGEVLGKIKKWIRGDDGDDAMTEERRQDLKGELGDVLWYVTILSRDLGFSLDEVAEYNNKKLLDRLERGKLHGDGDIR
ncbi:MAG: nucleoside triphosphate pyrophosphohydrolase family protein [Candidatus Pacebacteria bacterium]|nr:nucleoside triphosphate pyrophosphohydrolase family protein [Candidatus Paceibacterota bacterium]